MLSNSLYLAGTELASIVDAPTANPADIKAISQSLLASSAAALAAAQNRVVLQSYITRRDRLARGMLYASDKSWRENFHILTSLPEANAAADTALESGKEAGKARDTTGNYSFGARDYPYDSYRSRRVIDGDDRRDRSDRVERSRQRRDSDDADRDRRNSDDTSRGRRRSRSTN